MVGIVYRSPNSVADNDSKLFESIKNAAKRLIPLQLKMGIDGMHLMDGMDASESWSCLIEQLTVKMKSHVPWKNRRRKMVNHRG